MLTEQNLLHWLSTLCLLCCTPVCLGAEPPPPPDMQSPAPGSPLRKAVLDALRAEVRRLHGTEVVFVVETMRIKGQWAWVDTLPRSADGNTQLEGVSALLRKDRREWRVVHLPCTEVDNHTCVGGPRFPGMLLERFPGMPPEVLPASASGQSKP